MKNVQCIRFFAIVSLALIALPVTVRAQQSQNEKNIDASMIDRDGTSPEKAFIIKNISDYNACHSKESIQKEYAKTFNQKYDYYVTNRYGENGKDWVVGGIGKHYLTTINGREIDVTAIVLLPSKKEITLYFDFTEPFAALEKAEGKLEKKQDK